MLVSRVGPSCTDMVTAVLHTLLLYAALARDMLPACIYLRDIAVMAVMQSQASSYYRWTNNNPVVMCWGRGPPYLQQVCHCCLVVQQNVRRCRVYMLCKVPLQQRVQLLLPHLHASTIVARRVQIGKTACCASLMFGRRQLCLFMRTSSGCCNTAVALCSNLYTHLPL